MNHVDHKPWRSTESGLWEALLEDAIEDSVLEEIKKELQRDFGILPSDADEKETASRETTGAPHSAENGLDLQLDNGSPISTKDEEFAEPEETTVESMLEAIRKDLQEDIDAPLSDPDRHESLPEDTSDDSMPEVAEDESQDEIDIQSTDLNGQEVLPDEIAEDTVEEAEEQFQDEFHAPPTELDEHDPLLEDAVAASVLKDSIEELHDDVDNSPSDRDAGEQTFEEAIDESVLEDIDKELQHDFDAALEPTDEAVEDVEMRTQDLPADEEQQDTTAKKTGDETAPNVVGKTIDGDTGPITVREEKPEKSGGGGDKGTSGNGGGGGGNNSGGKFHERLGPIDFSGSLKTGLKVVRRNMAAVMVFSTATNILVLAIPIYLFQISDRVLTSRSVDTLVMLTAVIVGAVILQVFFDAIRRFMLMRTAVEVAVQLGSPTLSAAARASLHGNGREYQILGDLQQFRSFLTSGTLISFLDGPFAPLFILAIFLIHPDLGMIVVATAIALLVIATINQRLTSKSFADANQHLSKANAHLDSMARNSQIINALAMISEAVDIWGKDTASSLKSQVRAQDWNIVTATISRGIRLLTQVGMLGWGAYLAIEGEITGGMVIAASIIAGRALAPIEGAIAGWNQFVLSRASYERIANLLNKSPLNFERLKLPDPEGRLDVERLLYVPQGTKSVILNSVHFSLLPGESLAIIGDSGAGKTTLGKMLVGSILPTSGCVRLDLMDLRNWDQRQFGENIGYLPQDVQLFPGTIKDNIARMRSDASDADIFEAAKLADVHEMIASMPLGYETVVAVDGSPLSGGQKQRVALARAFFGNPKLVVLDEPNSNLDALGDRALYNALAHAKKHKITMVAITQKPALLQYVDKILLLSNGTVSMFGYRNDVLQALAESQNSGRLGQAGN